MQSGATVRGTYRLLIVVAEAALMYAAAWWGVVLALMLAGFKTGPASFAQEAWVAVAIVLLTIAVGRWMSRELALHRSRREARAAAIAFGLCTPVSWLLASLLAQLFGGYAGVLTGNRLSVLGAFVGTVTSTALLGFAASALSLRITRRIQKSEQREEVAS